MYALAFLLTPALAVQTPQGIRYLPQTFPVPNTRDTERVSQLYTHVITSSKTNIAFSNSHLSREKSDELCKRITLTPNMQQALAMMVQDTPMARIKVDLSIKRALFGKVSVFSEAAILFNTIPPEDRTIDDFNMFIERAIELGHLKEAQHALQLALVKGLADVDTFMPLIVDAFQNGRHQEAYALFQNTISLNIVNEELFALVIRESGKDNYSAATQFFSLAVQLGMAKEKVYNAIISTAADHQIGYALAKQAFATALQLGFHVDTNARRRLDRIARHQQESEFAAIVRETVTTRPILPAPTPSSPPLVQTNIVAQLERAVESMDIGRSAPPLRQARPNAPVAYIQAALNANPFDRQTVLNRIHEVRKAAVVTTELYVFLITTAHNLRAEDLVEALFKEANQRSLRGTITGDINMVRTIRLK